MLESRCAGLSWAEWLVLACAGVCDFNSWGHQFVVDDLSRIVGNPLIHSPQALWSLLSSPYQQLSGMAPSLYRPFTSLTFAFNWWISGARPDSFHLVNRFIHILICLGIFWVVRRLIPTSRVVPLCAALLFAVHPIQTEAITYIDGRSDALATLALIFIWFFFIRVRSEASTSWRPYVASLVFYFIGLLSKESAITWLGIAVLTEWIYFSKCDWRATLGELRRNAWRVYAGYALVTGVYLGLRFSVLHRFAQVQVTLLDNPLAHVATPTRVLTALKILFESLGLIFWPLHLSADYSYNQIPLLTRWLSLPGLGVLALTGMLLCVWIWSYRRNSNVFFGLTFFLMNYFLISNLWIPIGTIRADRLLYLPLLGICLAVAVGFEKILLHAQSQFAKRTVYAGLGVILVLMAARTIARNGVWKNPFVLYSQTVLDAPESAKAHNNLGVQFFNRGDMDAALHQYRIAEAIKPDYPDLLNNLGILFGREKKNDRAIAYLRNAEALDPSNLEIRNNLGLVLRAAGELTQAIAEYDRVIQRAPDNPEAHFNKANALVAAGKLDEAMKEYDRTLQIDPNYASARANMSAVLEQLERRSGANLSQQK